MTVGERWKPWQCSPPSSVIWRPIFSICWRHEALKWKTTIFTGCSPCQQSGLTRPSSSWGKRHRRYKFKYGVKVTLSLRITLLYSWCLVLVWWIYFSGSLRSWIVWCFGLKIDFCSCAKGINGVAYVTGCQLIPIFLYNSYIFGQNPIFWNTSYFSYIFLYFEHHSYIL